MRLLVVVDMQEDFIRGALTVPGAEEIISPIEKLVKEYITADDAVLFTRILIMSIVILGDLAML